MAKKSKVKKEVKFTNPDQHMQVMDITELAGDGFGRYSEYVITQRSLPDVRDGLIPVQRRNLFAMYKRNWSSKKPHVKSAKIVGEVMGSYHPHGDCLHKDTKVTLLNGNVLTIEELYKLGKDVEVLAIDNDGKIVPAKAHSFRIGQYTDAIYNIVLTNGTVIKTTGNHPFRMLNGSWVKAEDLKPLTFIDYGKVTTKDDYKLIKGYNTNLTTLHGLVYGNKKDVNNIIHHKNENKVDNTPENLTEMSRADHALLHRDYLKGLANGRIEMFTENGKYYKETKEKNSKLMSLNNQYYSIIRANSILNKMLEKDLELTIENYETFRETTYNLPKIDKMIEKGLIDSFEDLIFMNSNKEGIQKAIRLKFDLPELFKETESKEKINNFKGGLPTKQFINLVKELNRIPTLNEFVEMTNTNYILEFCENDEDLVDIMSNELPLIQEIFIEEVNQEPMYDFTVDNHENMLISVSNDNTLLASVHNSAIYGALARMSKQWIMGEIMVDMSGNNGSVDGDTEAAMRYTESRLSSYSEDLLLSNLSLKGIVPEQYNYDDTLFEPMYLPAKVPNFLINGSEGIAVGYASDTPTFNLQEVLDACIEHLKNPNIEDSELITFVPAPDFKTGGTIADYKSYAETLINGRGGIKVRGNYSVEEDKKNKEIHIIFNEIPYGSLKPKIIATILDAMNNKEISGIKEVRDDSDLDTGVNLVVTCSENANIDGILSFLFSKTQLQRNVPVNITAISKNKPKVLGVPQVIREFNEFRRETFIRGLEIQIKELEFKKHLNEGYVLLVDNIEQVIDLIKNSESKPDAFDKLLTIGFSKVQAKRVLDMSLHRINKSDKNAYESLVSEYAKQILQRQTILNSDELTTKAIIKAYEKIKSEYDTPRKTILKEEAENWDFSPESVIPKENMAVGITQDGFIKVSNFRSYKTSSVENDETKYVIETDTTQSIIIITEKGECAYIPVHKLPVTKWSDKGKHLSTLGLDIGTNEIAFASAYDGKDKDKTVFLLKNSGVGKQSLAFDYVKNRGHFTLTNGIKCKDDEKVIGGWLLDTNVDNFIAIMDNQYANMYFEAEEMPITSVRSGGASAIRLNKKQGRFVEEFALYHKESDIPPFCQRRERGQAGWNRKKTDEPVSLYEYVPETEETPNEEIVD